LTLTTKKEKTNVSNPSIVSPSESRRHDRQNHHGLSSKSFSTSKSLLTLLSHYQKQHFFTQITATITLEINIIVIDNTLKPLLNIIKTITMDIITSTIQKTKPSPQLDWIVVVIRRMIVTTIIAQSTTTIILYIIIKITTTIIISLKTDHCH